jgi:hypothetical protein
MSNCAFRIARGAQSRWLTAFAPVSFFFALPSVAVREGWRQILSNFLASGSITMY